ncbi:sodium/proline symporter PutP [Neobittarella massiliensis]|uniref:Sodium/proline symporter n=1 Tax=Neobittarella massiliensis (ex Bilen et al. 2018) TaxID=2041842 RepID=A0A8J6IML0_9FIRM|nr:sodium/proline symporter PutP [Neobittarella massiliensis]
MRVQTNLSVLITFILYLALMLGIGIFFFSKSSNLSDYFLGGRGLGSWVTAISAQASDMSGWLLMGLPAAAYISGLSASWIAIGLGLGTYLNWKIVAGRLRSFTEISGDSITIPQYLQNRFMSKSKLVRCICAIIIFVFFLVYTASAFNAGAKLVMYVLGMDDYVLALAIGAIVIVAYTFLGGFLAVCWTDLIQGILMFCAIVIVPVLAVLRTPDFSLATLSALEGGTFTNLFKNASGPLGWVAIISSLAWGLGYFGMPHILTRFMAIREKRLIKKSRLIAMIWVVISLGASVIIGMVGRTYLSGQGIQYTDTASAEVVFMQMVGRLAPGLIAGVLLSAILAAVMSTADSQLLVTASAVSNDFYKPLFRPGASDRELMWVSRGSVIAISVLAFIMALDPNSSVMGLVSYAWAGFGAAFGPVILLSLFWRRMTLKGAIAGMVVGGATILIWENVPLLSGTGLYSLVPGFALALVAVIVASLLDKAPDKEVLDQFERSLQAK